MERISVIMSVYNEPINYIDQAVESILNQTYSELECIVVVDNPAHTDAIYHLKSTEAKDPRVKVIINEQNMGLAMSMNAGIHLASGEYIARMDADDISLPERLQKELDYLQTTGADLVGCAVKRIDAEGNVIGTIHPPVKTPKEVERYLSYKNPIVHPTVLMKTSVIRALGGYRNFNACQDYDLWTRFATNGYQIYQMDEILFLFRRHEKSITTQRRFSQVINEMYIRQLTNEREKSGKDSFSEKNMEEFRNRFGADCKQVVEKESRKLLNYQRGISAVREHRFLKGGKLLIPSLTSRLVRNEVRMSLKVKNLNPKGQGE